MAVSYFKSAHKLITGDGALKQLSDEFSAMGVSRPLIVTDKGVLSSGLIDQVTALLPVPPILIIDDIPAEPEIKVIEAKLSTLKQRKVDSVIAVGGGSAIDSAKVLAATYYYEGELTALFGENLITSTPLPLIAIPTTAGTGSEVTNIAILGDPVSQMKKGIVSDLLLPDLAIVAPQMSLSCPAHITAASGVDAFVHGLEAFLSVNASPITDALAVKAMTLIYHHLPTAFAHGDNMQAREAMATGSLMAGMAFGNAGVGAVHALAYPLGGRFHLSHGISNAIMLAPVMKYNSVVCGRRMTEVARVLGIVDANTAEDQAVDALLIAIAQLCKTVGIPTQLRDFNIEQQDIPLLAQEASKVTRLLRNNPRAMDVTAIEQIYRSVY